MDLKQQLEEDISYVINRMYGASADLVEMGSQLQRIKFFNTLRCLIGEKEADNDELAVAVLDWAYQRLADD